MALSRLSGASLLCAGMFFGLNSWATTLVYKDFDQAVDEADYIVEGEIAAIESKTDDVSGLYRVVELKKVHFLDENGRVPGRNGARFFMAGGAKDGRMLQLAGAPEFSIDDHVILFITGNGNREVPFVGWEQGVLRINKLGEVTDNSGNRVLGKEGKSLRKEKNYGTVAQIVEAPNSSGASSESADMPEKLSGEGRQGRESRSLAPAVLLWTTSADVATDAASPSALPALDVDQLASLVKQRRLFRGQRDLSHPGGVPRRDTLYELSSPSFKHHRGVLRTPPAVEVN